ncbi:MAG: adenylate kinase [Candidatus Aenigmarchaeota archaeon ex4484_56]|nr:MAG: adenylate kinase [Candidatus Aenigmarchaeota archaeon ex4484_56]
MILIIIGPPASGKGTQAELISKKFKLKHISTGDLSRKINSEEIVKYLSTGKLVPDEFIFNILKKEISDIRDFILDGYPRTLNQAKLFNRYLEERKLSIDKVIYIKVSDETIIKRIVSRRICEKCGKVYSTLTYDKSVCECGGKLIQRSDDTEDVAKNRLEVFKRQTEPIINLYRDKVIEVDGEKNINDIFEQICKMLK